MIIQQTLAGDYGMGPVLAADLLARGMQLSFAVDKRSELQPQKPRIFDYSIVFSEGGY